MGDIGRLYLKEHNKANHRHTTHTSQVTKMKESKLCCTQKPDNSHSLQGALVIKKNNKVQSRIAGRKAGQNWLLRSFSFYLSDLWEKLNKGVYQCGEDRAMELDRQTDTIFNTFLVCILFIFKNLHMFLNVSIWQKHDFLKITLKKRIQT